MKGTRILIAGIGNIFFGDDAFGVEVAKQLCRRRSEMSAGVKPLGCGRHAKAWTPTTGRPISMCDWPDGVLVTDFGIRGIDLGYALLKNYDAVILLDATQQGGEPGTLYVVRPDLEALVSRDSQDLLVETHGMIPEKVLRWAEAMGARLPDVRLVGCEPARLGSENDMMMGLSEPVQAVVDEAVRLVEQLVDEILNTEHGLVT